MSVSLRLYGVRLARRGLVVRLCLPMHPVPFGSTVPVSRRHLVVTAQVLQDGRPTYGRWRLAVKLSINAELAYNFANATQIIANIEASHTSDQSVLSERLDIQHRENFLPPKPANG